MMTRAEQRRARRAERRSTPEGLEKERREGRERAARRRAAETDERRAERVASANRRTWLARLAKRGVSEDWYLTQLGQQGGRCAGCRTDDPGFREGSMWPVDHDHSTGKLRGLLCHRCNTALGLLDDDPETLRRLADYLAAVRWL